MANIAESEETLGYKKQQSIEQTFAIFEGYLIKEGLISEVSKKDYERLISEMIANPTGYSNIKNHVEDPKIYEDHYFIFNPPLMLTQCSDYVLVTQSHNFDSTINYQNNIIKRIIESDYSDLRVIKELFRATPDEDFQELMYRIPFDYIIIMNAYGGND